MDLCCGQRTKRPTITRLPDIERMEDETKSPRDKHASHRMSMKRTDTDSDLGTKDKVHQP